MSFPENAISVQVNGFEKKCPTRRSELEIKMDVLSVVGRGIDRPTQIMYKANLSWIALQSNLKSLVKSNFLREEDLGSRKRYELTQHGFDVLGTYKQVVDAMSALPPVQRQAF
ncbi:MAG: winged helix-turn-helix domain-containing protein [Nitrososphaerales archaeon]|jgi:predicted transcriptional regulator